MSPLALETDQVFALYPSSRKGFGVRFEPKAGVGSGKPESREVGQA